MSDGAAIAHVQVATWRTTYAGIVPDTYLAGLNEARRAEEWAKQLTCDADITVAGFICGGPVREAIDGCDAELYAVYLLHHAQRSGIGSGLLCALEHFQFKC